jgi:hypothetical protein
VRTPHVFPELGAWYLDIDNPNPFSEFEIVAIDPVEKTISIQYISGEIDELVEEAWFGMNLVAVSPPEERFAPYDMEREAEIEEYTEMGDDLLHPAKDAYSSISKL